MCLKLTILHYINSHLCLSLHLTKSLQNFATLLLLKPLHALLTQPLSPSPFLYSLTVLLYFFLNPFPYPLPHSIPFPISIHSSSTDFSDSLFLRFSDVPWFNEIPNNTPIPYPYPYPFLLPLYIMSKLIKLP